MQATAQGGEIATCFAALVMPDGALSVVRTIGFGNWEAESCAAAEAVGLIRNPLRVVVVYRTHSAATTAREPVVLTIDERTRRLAVDVPGSRSASLTGATTIKAVRQALAKTQ